MFSRVVLNCQILVNKLIRTKHSICSQRKHSSIAHVKKQDAYFTFLHFDKCITNKVTLSIAMMDNNYGPLTVLFLFLFLLFFLS